MPCDTLYRGKHCCRGSASRRCGNWSGVFPVHRYCSCQADKGTYSSASSHRRRAGLRSLRAQLRRGRRIVRFFAVLVVQFRCFVLYLICFTPNSFLFRTLAQRAAKRAKVLVILIEDDPAATAGGVSETTLPDPATIPQSSPQCSPQHKYMVYFLLLGTHGCSSFADI